MYIISEIKISFSRVSLCHSAAKIWGEEVHSGHPLSLKDPYVYIRYFLSEIHNHQRCPLFISLFPLFLNPHDFFRPWTVSKCTQVTIIHAVFWYLLIIACLLFHFRNKFLSQSIIIFFFPKPERQVYMDPFGKIFVGELSRLCRELTRHYGYFKFIL